MLHGPKYPITCVTEMISVGTASHQEKDAVSSGCIGQFRLELDLRWLQAEPHLLLAPL